MPQMFTPSYWFTLRVLEMTSGVGLIFLILFVLLVVASFALRYRANHTQERYARQTYVRISTLCLTMGIIGLFFAFFSYERIRLLGSRFWFPLWTLATILWALWIVRFTVKKVPAMRAQELERMEREKYLPGRKKK